MPDRTDSLSPPKRVNTEDPGAHELDTSESDDHFSDAHSAPSDSHPASPIPKTRVEKVSDEPSYGEVPGTEAYRMREGDAEPDEIAVIPEPAKESSSSDDARSPTPGGKPIPKTMVEETSDSAGSETHPEKRHRADPPPDLVLKADDNVKGGESATDTPITPLKTPNTARSRRKHSLVSSHSHTPRSAGFEGGDDGDDFGDDFDDFEEGEEGEEFDDFEAGFEEPAAPAVAPPPPVQPLPFPVPDFDGLDADDILSATEQYLDAMFPIDADMPTFPPLSKENPIFLTPRSASLWSQLVAPPPLQPPDWIRSRIRRLFLVSLGVPVDLDEILPASKQKKLVLPSLSHRDSPRTSTDSRPSHISKLKQSDANASSTSLDSQGKVKESSRGGRKGPPPAPELDLVAAKQLCMTTDEALDGMTDEELQEHVKKLEAMEGTAKELLDYWRKRADEKIGDREAFEGVIENLVKHARKVRK